MNIDQLDSANPDVVIRIMAHELTHFLSSRQLLQHKDEVVPVRAGLTFIRNALVDRVVVRSDEGNFRNKFEKDFHFESWAGTPINEAMVEIFAASVLNSVKSNFTGFQGSDIKPYYYPDERRMFGALVENIVLAWNNPSLRMKMNYRLLDSKYTTGNIWRSRIEKLANELGWTTNITNMEVMQLFEQALYEKRGLTKIARLINCLFGDGAFVELWNRSPSDTDAQQSYSQMWKIFYDPVQIVAMHKSDIAISLNGQRLNINNTEIPDGVACKDFERSDGTVLGLETIFNEYQKLFDAPFNFDEIAAVAIRAMDLYRNTHENYPFSMKMLHVEQKGTGSVLTTPFRKGCNFAFDILKKALKLSDQPTATYRRTVLDASLFVESFSCPSIRNKQIVRVSQQRGVDGQTGNPFVGYFVQWSPN